MASSHLRGRGEIDVAGRRLTARHIVICSGSEPAIPDVPGLAGTHYFTNETIFDELKSLPTRLAVIGGGPVGCELAQAFARLGSRVTLIQSNDRLLPREDPAVSPALRRALERDGVTVHTGATLTRVTATAAGARSATLSIEGKDAVEADAILVATGRRARTEGFGLEEAGVSVSPGGITVDPHLRTTAPGVWASGDCVGPHRFTHVAETMGRTILRNILVPWLKEKVDYSVVPWCTFTNPEVGRVGLTEHEAREKHGSGVQATTMPMSRIDRAVTEDARDGFIKLVTRGNKILGAQVVGPAAGELIQQVALAMRSGLPVSALSMIAVYPAYSYGLHQTADRAALSRLRASRVAPLLLALLRRLALAAR